MPKWLMSTLGVFAILFVLGAVFGKTPEPAPQPVAAPAASAEVIPPSTSVPPPITYRVSQVTDGATVELAGSDGSHRTVHVLGIAVATGSNCYAAETATWATTKLIGSTVHITTDTATGVAFSLDDGTDYATAALENGYAQLASDAASATLRDAETVARQAVSGLWAAPCKGLITAPTPQPPAQQAKPAPTKKTTTHAAPPPRTTEEEPAPAPAPESIYYKNCAAARAAGAAPLHAGEPGYSRKLDRDGDGVACE
ncbi:thermonuclease family protein [Amycolatopsis jiangsuensis]|uniref:Endonuclease YncB(Thermonuclease family) n=1 Tax=Amycolatopsis jiangsuensis TaxID=1181879 RepID=A0A840J083_9PSEU|nr:excalibur calcium-binding domain-containing protein [Amycolatopsis jiangsuensis]MBB4687055.1 endonuclease YncB(thermonuclease family) [Amycolatopsis jiangsuensis]